MMRRRQPRLTLTVMQRAAILALVLAACSCVDSAVDPLESLTQIEPPRAAEALTVAVTAFEAEVGAPMPTVHVTWVAERIPYEGTTVIGLHRNCEDIWLTWWDGPRFSRLALAHEIGHCARAARGLDTDPGHADAAWWAKDGAGVVDRVNRQLAGAGL